jgi:hypothetical protein
MRTRLFFLVTGTALVALTALAPWTVQPAAAQLSAERFLGKTPDPTEPAGPVPRTADGRPDLSGVWWAGADVPVRTLRIGRGRPRPDAPPPGTFQSLYNPAAMAKWKALGDRDDPTLHCIPVAFGTVDVGLWGVGFIGQIIQSPKFVAMLTETYHSFKLVPTDGRPHRDDVAPSYRGDSVGRWEGDTLVVDTTNFTDDNWLYAEGDVSFHSDALHIVERYTRLDTNRLQVDAVIEDPKVLTAPYKVPRQVLKRAPFDQIMELTCASVETAALMEAAAKQGYGRPK